MAESKHRAARNRTVTVSESEIPFLEQYIGSAENVRLGFHDDMIVNSDLFECLDAIPDEYFELIVIAPYPYRVDGRPKDWEETTSGNFRITYPSNFWDDISVPFWSMPENTDHPTQKPEKLYAKLVLASSRPGDRIFDPFLGSGTLAVVARKLGRRFCGVEINREYCLWAAKRLLGSSVDRDIQGYSGGVFWERNSLGDQKKCHDGVYNKTVDVQMTLL